MKITKEQVEEQIEFALGDYAFEFKYKEVEGYDGDNAFEVSITPRFCQEFIATIHVEFWEDKIQFEQGEDCWQEITEDELFKFLFFEALSELRN